MVTKLKAFSKYDDSLDVFGVHCMGSSIGMLLLGFVANGEVNPALLDTFNSGGQAVSQAGSTAQFFNQAKAVLFRLNTSVSETNNPG